MSNKKWKMGQIFEAFSEYLNFSKFSILSLSSSWSDWSRSWNLYPSCISRKGAWAQVTYFWHPTTFDLIGVYSGPWNRTRIAPISNVRRYPSVWIEFAKIFPQFWIQYETRYLKQTLVASCLSCGGSTTHEGSKKYTWPLGDLKELVFTNNSGNSRQRGLIVPSPTMLPATRNQESSVAWPFGSDYHNDGGKILFDFAILFFTTLSERIRSSLDFRKNQSKNIGRLNSALYEP